MVANNIGGKPSNTLLRALLDTGSTHNLIHKSAIPTGVELQTLGEAQKLMTVAGQYTSLYRVSLDTA